MSKKNIYYYVGNLKNDMPLFINNVDISKYSSIVCYKYYIFGIKRKVRVRSIFVRAIPLMDKTIFFGIKKDNSICEIYKFSDEYELKLKRMYDNYTIHNDDQESLQNLLWFLFNEYDFKFAKNNLGNAVNKNGKFFYYGPVYSYSIYNSDVCINILHLVQRDEYQLFITDEYRVDQVYIRNGVEETSFYAGDFLIISKYIKQSINSSSTVFGRSVKRVEN